MGCRRPSPHAIRPRVSSIGLKKLCKCGKILANQERRPRDIHKEDLGGVRELETTVRGLMLCVTVW